MVSAASGLSFLTGFPGRSPRGLGVAYPDFTSPFLIPLLVLSGLRQRDRDDRAVEMELN
jgi:crotonobetainyl-CoA:carnitine CoA-transferase CaiB-like acyl-CoA transferase